MQTVRLPARKLARVGPAGEVVVEHRADVGEPQRARAPLARVDLDPGQLALHLADLPLVGAVDLVSAATPPASPSSHSASGRVPVSRSVAATSRSTYSANRPASSTRLLPTSSSGSAVPSQACESSDIATPVSTRSRPNRQVFWR